MKIAIAADHRGHAVKERISVLLHEQGHEVLDMGTNSSKSCDYTDVAYPAAKSVADSQADRAILICGSGIGMDISANKINGIRAALCHDELTAQMSRRHNDSNVLYGTGHGTFKSTDFAAHWQPIDRDLPTGQVIRQDPANDQILYHGSYSPSGAVFRTTDAGANWTKTLVDVAIDDISVAPSNPSIVFAVGLEDPFVGAIFKSVDTGVTWSIASPIHADCVAIDPTNEEIVYAGTPNGVLNATIP